MIGYVLMAWVVASVPLALFVGRVCSWNDRVREARLAEDDSVGADVYPERPSERFASVFSATVPSINAR